MAIDSNVTGLRYAEEASLGVLPGSPVWYPLEPNSYQDFGGSITTIARNPINASRQRLKGVTTDLDASGGFNMDLTQFNLTRLMQSFFFAAAREKTDTAPLNGTAITITNVDGTAEEYDAASGLDAFTVGRLVYASGFTNAANNGLKTVASAAAGALGVSENLVDETPPAGARIQTVGVVAGADDIDVDATGSIPALVSTTLNFTTLGLIPGEWIFIGGDSAGLRFTTTANNGFARIATIAANRLELDKTDSTMANETSAGGKTLQIFFGTVIQNELDALVTRRTVQLERTLGEDGSGTMSEYIVGAVANEFSMNVQAANKVECDLSFIGIDNEQYDGATGVKSGARPSIQVATAFNTSTDFSRIRLAIVTPGDAAPTPLFAFVSEITLSINNNASPEKAIAVLGSFDVTAGTFEVGGSLTAYFADIAAVQAVRNNSDVTIDIAMVKENAGILFDVPLLSLGDGRLNVEQDQKIDLPLELAGARNDFDTTLLMNVFDYLPTLAE